MPDFCFQETGQIQHELGQVNFKAVLQGLPVRLLAKHTVMNAQHLFEGIATRFITKTGMLNQSAGNKKLTGLARKEIGDLKQARLPKIGKSA